MTFVDPVKGFKFNIDGKIDETDLAPLVFSSQFPAVDNQTATSFYQVIGDGKVKLLKYYKKILRSDQAFNSATVTKTFVLIDIYYLFTNNQMVKIKPGQKTILAALNNKADQVQSYLKANPINYKSDAALAKLFTYYNSL